MLYLALYHGYFVFESLSAIIPTPIIIIIVRDDFVLLCIMRHMGHIIRGAEDGSREIPRTKNSRLRHSFAQNPYLLVQVCLKNQIYLLSVLDKILLNTFVVQYMHYMLVGYSEWANLKEHIIL